MSEAAISQAEFARRHGVSRQYVSKLVGQARLVMDGDLIRVPESDAIIGKPHDDAPAPTGGTYNELALRKLAAETEQAELKLRRMDGTLVDRREVEAAVVTIFADLKDKLLDVPVKIAGKLMAKPTEREVAFTLREAIEDELTVFAQTIADKFPRQDIRAEPGHAEIPEMAGERDADRDADGGEGADAPATPAVEPVGGTGTDPAGGGEFAARPLVE
ncbi:MAG: hypothetical protein SFV21_12645 [Rhodospirillaceae bacterium]|nr:hypothetical protein [Rhodospirillaceae bacterium]